jgi:hypothetical protein
MTNNATKSITIASASLQIETYVSGGVSYTANANSLTNIMKSAGSSSLDSSEVIGLYDRRLNPDLYRKYQNQLHSIVWHSVDIAHVVNTFNHGQLADIKCYATKTVLDQYQNSVFIFGHHGNQVLLHKYIFLDEIRIRYICYKISPIFSFKIIAYTQSYLFYELIIDFLFIYLNFYLSV